MKTIYIEKTDISGTLSNWVYCGLWQMYTAEKLGMRSYIHWPHDRKRALAHYYDDKKFKEVPNMWDWYFEQPMLDSAPPREDVWMWEQPRPDLAHALNDHYLYSSVGQIRAFYQKYLKFKPAVISRGNAIIAKYGVDPDKTTGVMWRGTESIHDGRPRMPIETYYPFIDDILYDSALAGKSDEIRIMCSAEEETIIDPLLRRYPKNAFTVSEFAMSPLMAQERGDNPEKFMKCSGYEKGMQPAVLMYVFSKCKHLIKNRCTTSSIASWLSNGRTVCLAHPENLGHGFDITKAEIDGQLVPLNGGC